MISSLASRVFRKSIPAERRRRMTKLIAISARLAVRGGQCGAALARAEKFASKGKRGASVVAARRPSF